MLQGNAIAVTGWNVGLDVRLQAALCELRNQSNPILICKARIQLRYLKIFTANRNPARTERTRKLFSVTTAFVFKESTYLLDHLIAVSAVHAQQ